MIDLPDNPVGPFVIVQIVSGRNVQMIREHDDQGYSTYLHYVFSQRPGHFRLIQESDLAQYKAVEAENNKISRTSDDWPRDPENFPRIY